MLIQCEHFSEGLPTPTEGEFKKFLIKYRESVGNTLANSLPPIIQPSSGIREPSSASGYVPGSDENLMTTLPAEQLLALRQAHETEFARKAVRTVGEDTPPNKVTPSEAADSRARYRLIKKINEVLKLQQDLGIGTGLERQARWSSTQPAGNSANAAAAATSRATQVCSYCEYPS